jgi:outer membrane protein assembly factor BamB
MATHELGSRTVKSAFLAAISIFALAGICFSQSATLPTIANWPQFRNSNMQRWNPSETVLNVSTVGNLHLLWTYYMGVPFQYGVTSSPAVVNGVVYVGAEDGNIYALNASTGVKLWSIPTTERVYSSPAVANGVVYVASYNTFYALNADTGAVVWSLPMGTYSSPVVVGGVVYVGAFDGNVYALDAGTGSTLWSYPTGSNSFTSLAAANGLVFAGTRDNNLYAVNASTGALVWSLNVGGVIDAPPAVAGGVVYVGSTNNKVYAIDAASGNKLWTFTAGGAINLSSPAVANGAVYVGTEEPKLYALNAATGALLWSDTIGLNHYNGVDSSPAIANGVVYVGTNDQNVYALDASTGAVLWSHGTGDMVQSSPSVVNGMVYIGSLDGNLYGFGLPTATLNLSAVAYPTPPKQGALLTYAFKVWNKSSQNAVHEVLTTAVPPGTVMSSIEWSGTQNLTSCQTPFVGGSGPVVCKESNVMRPGSTWTIRITVQVTAPKNTVITETATASSDNQTSSTATLHNTVR